MGRILRRAVRIASLAVAGGFIAGMSVFGLGVTSPDSASLGGREVTPATEAREAVQAVQIIDGFSPRAVAKCRKSKGVVAGLKDDGDWATWAPGGKCKGAPLAQCTEFEF